VSPEERIVELEIKLAFHEKWVAELDEVVRALRGEVDTLRAEVDKLHEHVRPQSEPVVDEKPPHY
jgi:uncharacterized coiled-coil protein SlyX